MYPHIYSTGIEDNNDEESNISLFQNSEKEDFTEDYGGYLELIYLITNGDLLKANSVYEMPAHEFLFYCQYLLRKRKIENMNPNQIA